jgi:transcriptional regulator with XRE-family HTH domain
MISENPKDFLIIKPSDLLRLSRSKHFRAQLMAEFVAYQIRTQIRGLRLSRGLTQKQMAEASGIDQSVISNAENTTSKRFPTTRNLMRIADFFDVGLVIRFGEWREVFEEIISIQKDGVKIPFSFAKTNFDSIGKNNSYVKV